MVRTVASHQCHPGSNSCVDAICGWVFVGPPLLCPTRFFPRYSSINFPSRLKKKLAKNGRRRTTMCWCQLPLNRFLFVIVYYSSYITKPSEKFSYLMIIIIINVHDQLTTTLSILWYFVARKSTSVMRQEQMMGGMISSICPLRFFYGFHVQEE